MTPPESVAMQDNADSTQDSSHLPFLLLDLLDSHLNRPLKRRHKMRPVRKCVASQENYLSFLIYAEIQGIAMGMNTNTWDNGDNNIKLDQAELIDMGSLSGEFSFNIVPGKLGLSQFVSN